MAKKTTEHEATATEAQTETLVVAPLTPDDAPILPGYEGDGSEYVTVLLTQSTEADAVPYRIAKRPELPLALALNGSRYLISDHAKKLYVWQVK